MIRPAQQPLTRARVEHALQLLAKIVVDGSDGDADAIAPIYQRLELELETMPYQHDIRGRARAYLIAAVAERRKPMSIKKATKLLKKKIPAVYFVRSGDFVKIGKSTSWEDRLAALRTGSPHPVTPLLVLPGGCETERELHVRFKNHRVNGEWFRPAAEIMAYIEKHQSDGLLLEVSP